MAIGRIPEPGSGIQESIIAAKGDLISGTANDVPAILTVGADGTTLVADSAEATGLKWATAAANVPANASLRVEADESTSSTSYTGLTTAQAVTVTTGTRALVIVTASFYGDSSPPSQTNFMSYAVSGATTIASADSHALRLQSLVNRQRFSGASTQTLTAGSNTFTAQFRVSSGLGAYTEREIFVINLA